MRLLLILIITLCVSFLLLSCSGKEDLSPGNYTSGTQAEDLYNESVNLNSNELFASIANFDSTFSYLYLNYKNLTNAQELYFVKINGEDMYASTTPAPDFYEYTRIPINKGFLPDTNIDVEIRVQLYNDSLGIILDKTYTNSVRAASRLTISSADSLLSNTVPYHFDWNISSKNQFQYVTMRSVLRDEYNNLLNYNQFVKGVDQNTNNFTFPMNCVELYPSPQAGLWVSVTGFNSTCNNKFLLFSQQTTSRSVHVDDKVSLKRK